MLRGERERRLVLSFTAETERERERERDGVDGLGWGDLTRVESVLRNRRSS